MPLRLAEYLKQLRSNANRLERIDINGVPATSFLKKYQRRLICFGIAIIIVVNLDKGFSENFVSYVSSVLSILVGLFTTALIFCFDKVYNPQKSLNQYFEVNIKKSESDIEKRYEVDIYKPNITNSKTKLWEIQTYNYAKLFSYVTGYNIVLAAFALVLLSLSSLFPTLMNFNVYTYKIDIANVTRQTIGNFFIGFGVISQRILVLYWIGSIFYNTLFIVSSIVNFMTIKNDRTND